MQRLAGRQATFGYDPVSQLNVQRLLHRHIVPDQPLGAHIHDNACVTH